MRRTYMFIGGCAGPYRHHWPKLIFPKFKIVSQFVELVSGKTLTRPLIKLEVRPDGKITGKGARWAVTGSWTWRDGYFCRDPVSGAGMLWDTIVRKCGLKTDG